MTDKVVKRCGRTWRRIGVSRDVAAEMAAELEADLAAAREDGRDPESYVGGDPAGFARAWASERGAVPVRARAGRLMAAALLGGLPGALTGLFMVFGLSSEALAEVLGRDPAGLDVPGWLVFALYGLSGAFAWAGVLAAVSAVLRFHADAARQRTLRALAVVLPLAGLAAAAGTALAARAYAYPFGPIPFAIETTAPVATILATVTLTRLATIRTPKKNPRTNEPAAQSA
ncbi:MULTISPECIES: hypothetical protein [Actinomadura]|uniref:DUF1129 family protein n=1 Tax=Actinomadura yumaensis TaxID=111807 RepID=A0ABW2D366_9ACTN|nr:hypothetical protein [Actinomadura sp. J1-007]MWK36354.1 hypothetical protein [Actinomadura sp. J1-007]